MAEEHVIQKNLIASQLLAAEILVKEGIEDIGLLYVVSGKIQRNIHLIEETDHLGMIVAKSIRIKPRIYDCC